MAVNLGNIPSSIIDKGKERVKNSRKNINTAGVTDQNNQEGYVPLSNAVSGKDR